MTNFNFNFTLTDGFYDSVDNRLNDVAALDGLTYEDLAEAVLTSTTQGSFASPRYGFTVYYREVTVNGALFGVGYTTNRAGDVTVRNVLTEGMVRWNRTQPHVTVQTVEPFVAS